MSHTIIFRSVSVVLNILVKNRSFRIFTRTLFYPFIIRFYSLRIQLVVSYLTHIPNWGEEKISILSISFARRQHVGITVSLTGTEYRVIETLYLTLLFFFFFHPEWPPGSLLHRLRAVGRM